MFTKEDQAQWIHRNAKNNPPTPQQEREYTMEEANERLIELIKKAKIKKQINLI